SPQEDKLIGREQEIALLDLLPEPTLSRHNNDPICESQTRLAHISTRHAGAPTRLFSHRVGCFSLAPSSCVPSKACRARNCLEIQSRAGPLTGGPSCWLSSAHMLAYRSLDHRRVNAVTRMNSQRPAFQLFSSSRASSSTVLNPHLEAILTRCAVPPG